MHIKHNISLKPYNTFGIDVKTKQFVEVKQLNDLIEILQNNKLPLLILGGGSNLLFTKNFDGLVIKNELKGIDLVKEDKDNIYLKVGAGEIWHEFVLYCIEKNYAGIENLSLIPGCVGASPIQNIGAYGVEVKDIITEVEAFDLNNFTIKKITNNECEFGYRTSIFKTKEKGNYLITAVTFKLSKIAEVNVTYGAITQELTCLGIKNPSIADVSKAIVNIRTNKLPNPNEIGNSGSFFKNPVIAVNVKNKLETKYPNMPSYPQKDGTYKIAAGWLIEQCGWKGKKIDNYGVHKNQALVLVNYGGASGQDILALSTQIMLSVKEQFNIELEREVNII